MAQQEHVALANQGADAWNVLRNHHVDITPDLSEEDLSGAKLIGADLHELMLRESRLRIPLRDADLRKSILTDTDLRGADLEGADLSRANLEGALLVATRLQGADLSGARLHGISVWDMEGTPRHQANLVITPRGQRDILADELEVAQFLYLLVDHKRLRTVLNSLLQRGVLLLGLFSDGGLRILYSIADRLRQEGYLPIIFDFERPEGHNYVETATLLAGLSRFVIVELSGPSVPAELQATVPKFRIPFVPVASNEVRLYSLFPELQENTNVLPLVRYSPLEHLQELLRSLVIAPAEKKWQEREAWLKEHLG